MADKHRYYYRPKSGFALPDDPEQPIWRYLSQKKFWSLLSDRALHFCPLARLPDKWEGSLTRAEYASQREHLPRLAAARGEPVKKWEDIFTESSRLLTHRHAVSCWHLNHEENVLMWPYAGERGVVIRSTVARLIAAFPSLDSPGGVNTRWQVNLGVVRYLDHESEAAEVHPWLAKRKMYEGERELRAVIRSYDARARVLGINLDRLHLDPPVFDAGVLVPIDVAALIERVHVAPGVDVDAIRATAREHGFDLEVNQSRLAENPIF